MQMSEWLTEGWCKESWRCNCFVLMYNYTGNSKCFTNGRTVWFIADWLSGSWKSEGVVYGKREENRLRRSKRGRFSLSQKLVTRNMMNYILLDGKLFLFSYFFEFYGIAVAGDCVGGFIVVTQCRHDPLDFPLICLLLSYDSNLLVEGVAY